MGQHLFLVLQQVQGVFLLKSVRAQVRHVNGHARQVAADFLASLMQGLIGKVRYVTVQTGSQIQ